MIFVLIRKKFLDDRTLGYLLKDGVHFCYTLENPVRDPGIKVDGKTAIPAGVYRLGVNYSAKFKREMNTVLDVPNFTGIRLHGGNDVSETDGCPLIAYNLAAANKIYGTAEKEFTAIVRSEINSGRPCHLIVVNDNLNVMGWPK